jgi:SAM-dependent methyltransferase
MARVPSSWSWDETLFAGSAQYYERGRLPYAPDLPHAFADTLAPDGRGRLLDVGCGPGTVARLVAHLFEAVVGLDPDPDMLEEAQRLATAQGIPNAQWVRHRAEELPAGLGTFRVITFAASFHWMERWKVARAVRSMLVPGGAVVHVDNHHQDSSDAEEALPYPSPPEAAIDDLRRRYLGPDRRAGQSIRNSSPDDEDDVFRASGFSGPERVRVGDGRVLTPTIDDLVAAVFSKSSTAPHLFGHRLGEFEGELRALLVASSLPGLFSVRLPDNELKIWRPSSNSQGAIAT